MTSSSDRMAALVHELKLLVDMVLENSAPWLESLEAAGHGGGSSHTSPDADDGKPHSDWCAWCLLVDLARRDTSELSARATAQATQLISLLRAVLADRFHPGEGVHLPTLSLPGFGSDAESGSDTGSGSDGVDADADAEDAQDAEHADAEPEPESGDRPSGRHAFPGDVLAAQSMPDSVGAGPPHGRHAMPDTDDEPADDGQPEWQPSPSPRSSHRVQKIPVRKTWYE